MSRRLGYLSHHLLSHSCTAGGLAEYEHAAASRWKCCMLQLTDHMCDGCVHRYAWAQRLKNIPDKVCASAFTASRQCRVSSSNFTCQAHVSCLNFLAPATAGCAAGAGVCVLQGWWACCQRRAAFQRPPCRQVHLHTGHRWRRGEAQQHKAQRWRRQPPAVLRLSNWRCLSPGQRRNFVCTLFCCKLHSVKADVSGTACTGAGVFIVALPARFYVCDTLQH